jgi:hypothetical protein
MSDFVKGVKKVPFDGTKAQSLGSAKTYNCQQEILGTIPIPKATDALNERKDADKKLLLARKMNDTAMCLFNLSLTHKVSQMALYNGKTADLPNGDAAKVWRNFSIQKHQQKE